MSIFCEVAMMSPAEREQLLADLDNQREIDRSIRELETRLRIRRIATLMPADATDPPPSSTPGHAEAGAFFQEPTP